MRINSLEIKDFYHIKSSRFNIANNESVIAIICSKDVKFIKTEFMYAMEQLFCDNFDMRGGEIKCECQKNGKKYFVELFAKKCEEKRTIFGKNFSGKKIVRKQTCLCEETVSDRIKWFCGLNYKNWLYPTPFWDYGVFRGESMFGELVFGVEEGSLFETTLKEEKDSVVESLNKSVNNLNSNYINGKELCLDVDGKVCVKKGGYVNDFIEDMLCEDEKQLANFLFWLTTLNIIKQICKDTNRLLDFPIFIENFFEKIKDYSNMDMIFQNIRCTGRQVFIILNEHNDKVETYCDKVVEID